VNGDDPAVTRPVLLTGFEPFSVYPVNSSGQTAAAVGALMPDLVHAEVCPSITSRPTTGCETSSSASARRPAWRWA
jgi:hypothetical protein